MILKRVDSSVVSEEILTIRIILQSCHCDDQRIPLLECDTERKGKQLEVQGGRGPQDAYGKPEEKVLQPAVATQVRPRPQDLYEEGTEERNSQQRDVITQVNPYPEQRYGEETTEENTTDEEYLNCKYTSKFLNEPSPSLLSFFLPPLRSVQSERRHLEVRGRI